MKSEIFFIIVLILVAVIGAYFIGTNEEEQYTGEFITYTVIPGDTLWGIASGIESDADIRKIVYTIKQDNGLNDGIIYAWQELKLRTNY